MRLGFPIAWRFLLWRRGKCTHLCGAFGYLLGAVVGFTVGWLAMDNIAFVNPKYHDGEENHDATE
jgi:hypothetical protein